MAAMLKPDIVADLEKAADLRPRDCRLRVVATIQGFFFALAQIKDGADPRLMEKEIQAKLDGAMAQLRPLTQDKDMRLAGEAAAMLAILSYFDKGNPDPQTEKWARRAVELDPDNFVGWDFLMITLLDKKKNAEAAEACAEILKRQDSAKYRFQLAKLHDKLAKPDEAERYMRDAVQSFPEDATCRQGLAVLLVKRGTPEALKQASEQLDQVETLLKKKPSRALQNDCLVMRAILEGLSGDPGRAREMLQRILDDDREHELATKALKALN